jgi:hypothetical protein
MIGLLGPGNQTTVFGLAGMISFVCESPLNHK